MKRLYILFGLTFLFILFFSLDIAFARPGGGHSYKSSSSYSSSSSGYSGSSPSYPPNTYLTTDDNYDTESSHFVDILLFLFILAVFTGILFVITLVAIFRYMELLMYYRHYTAVALSVLVVIGVLLFYRALEGYRAGEVNYFVMILWLALPANFVVYLGLLPWAYKRDVLQPFKFKQKKLSEIEGTVERIMAIDKNFSRFALEDFVTSLFIRFYEYSEDKKKYSAYLAPFVSWKELEKWSGGDSFDVSEVVVGTVSILPGVSNNSKFVKVKISANYTFTGKDNASYRAYTTEIWTLKRDIPISPEPDKMRDLQCPVCGAPAKFTDAGKCEYCGSIVTLGKQQWYLFLREQTDFSKEKISSGLAYYAEDKGYLDLTVTAPDLDKKISEFESTYNLQWNTYFDKLTNEKIKPVFFEIYKAWTEMEWERIRHLMSDRLWESWKFWIDNYRKGGYRNVIEDVDILRIEIANLETDRFYEALTVRVFASAKDYTLRQKEDFSYIAGGSKKKKKFSEYWTFVRYRGVEDKHDIYHCPNCGAPADKIGQTGICEYCGTKITTGHFGWILFKVVQDEVFPA